MLLLDASVWVAAGVPAHSGHAASAAVLRSGQRVGVLDLTLYEVANTVGLQYRDPAQAAKLCALICRLCVDQPARVDARLIEMALEEVAKHGLSAYDAAYVAAARRTGWQLVSLDIRDLVSKGLAVTPDAAV